MYLTYRKYKTLSIAYWMAVFVFFFLFLFSLLFSRPVFCFYLCLMLAAPELRWYGAVANLWIWFEQHCSFCSFKTLKHRRMRRDVVASLKPGFHYQSWRPELTARVDGWPVSITRQHGPCWRARVSTSQVDGPSTRPVNLASGNRALVTSRRSMWKQL